MLAMLTFYTYVLLDKYVSSAFTIYLLNTSTEEKEEINDLT